MPPHDAVVSIIGQRGWEALRRSTLLHLRSPRPTSTTTASFHAGANANIRVNYANANPPSIVLTHHPISLGTTPRYLSSAPQPSSSSSSPANSSGNIPSHLRSTIGQDEASSKSDSTIGAPSSIAQQPSLQSPPAPTDSKSIFSKLWDRYSFQGQQKRIVMGERLFRSAQVRANDLTWYREARIPNEFRTRHAILTMHVWFLHKRLLADRVDPHAALLIQEELFDILWNDARARIRAEGVNELTVNKHLKDVQQLTFKHCTHYDHAFHEYGNDPKRRFEELALAVWMHVLNKDEEAYDDQLRRLAAYVEYQYANIVMGVPDTYFWEGRIPWGNIPDFSGMKDNDGKALGELEDIAVGLEEIPRPWMKTLTDAGDTYYWNTESNETTWKRPI